MTDEDIKAIRMLEFIVNHNSLLGYKPKNRQALAEYILNLIEKRDKQLQAIYEEFNKYNWENSTETQLRNQIKSLYNAIKGEFINDR